MTAGRYTPDEAAAALAMREAGASCREIAGALGRSLTSLLKWSAAMPDWPRPIRSGRPRLAMSRAEHRMAAAMLRRGTPVDEMARALGYTDRVVLRWRREILAGGPDA